VLTPATACFAFLSAIITVANSTGFWLRLSTTLPLISMLFFGKKGRLKQKQKR
jgi:hypothetical protein